MVDCVLNDDGEYDCLECGCDGSTFERQIDYLYDIGTGLFTYDTYPYTSKDSSDEGICKTREFDDGDIVYKRTNPKRKKYGAIKDDTYVDLSSDNKTVRIANIKSALIR